MLTKPQLATDLPVAIPRAPRTDAELHALIKAFWGIDLPRVQVCPEHVSPFQAVADAFFGRDPGYAVWYASRGSGKSLALAVLGLTKTLVHDIDTTILGGSMTQSQNVATHMDALLRFKRAPVYALKGGSVDKAVTATQITLASGKRIRPIPASQTTVRGPHPPLSLLDEVDEMEWDIYEAAMGQAMEQVNTRGEIVGEYIVASSTWQHPDGTFTKVIEQARERGMPVYSWCWRELLQPHGWMSKRFIDQKRKTVSAEMWRTEYDLNEPSGTSRAFDLDKIEEYFIAYPEPIAEHHDGDDDEWTWEEYETAGLYATGADWAKEVDKTVYATIRYDVTPRRLVHLRRVNKRPYPEMIAGFDEIVKRYNSVAQHDKTGLGNVVHDFSEAMASGMNGGFNFTDKRKRSQMLLGYITDFEQGGYRLPKVVIKDATAEKLKLNEFYKGHRATTNKDVFGNFNSDGDPKKHHLPDDVAAMALAHLAAGRIPTDLTLVGVGKDNTPREVDKQFHVKPPLNDAMVVGEVTIVDERYDDVAVFDLMI